MRRTAVADALQLTVHILCSIQSVVGTVVAIICIDNELLLDAFNTRYVAMNTAVSIRRVLRQRCTALFLRFLMLGAQDLVSTQKLIWRKVKTATG